MTAARRRLFWLLGGALGYVFVCWYVFAAQVAGAYVRGNYLPRPGESALALADCGAPADCAGWVGGQESLLSTAATLVRGGAWSLPVFETAALLATVLLVIVRGGPSAAARLLDVVWKVQAVAVAALLAGFLVLLTVGAGRFTDTPEAARTITFTVAFDAPFLDVGHAYLLAWFLLLSGVGVALKRAAARSVRRAGQAVA
jgi:hypothetical protein